MGLHKLTAGDGYTYLTRQVAAGDSTERGYASLGEYYSAKGESPGTWMGSGADVLSVAGRQVTETQMRNLFGQGVHPNADLIRADLIGRGWTGPTAEAATLLGARYAVFDAVPQWRTRLAEKYAAWNTAHKLPANRPMPAEVRAKIRTALARDMFTEEHGRDPLGPRELDGYIRQVSRPASTAVAGYDLTFTPVKSVSTLWAVAPRPVSAAIEQAHHAAVAATLTWLERHVAYTRVGARGIAQVDTDGLTAAAFTHRDSRAGDPDLHTHVAVSNKVRVTGSQDRWLALDGRMIHRYAVAASELYNTLIEAEITDRIGGRFAERPADDPSKRPVRELVGIDPRLNQRWSTRREAITDHRQQLVADFHAAHGRLPTPVELLALSQQATLATRDPKHEPRSLDEQRATWRAQALQVLGGPAQLDRMLTAAADRTIGRSTTDAPAPPGRADLARLAADTVAATEQSRALWSAHNLTAEAARQLRGRYTLTAQQTIDAVERIAAMAAGDEHSIPVTTAPNIDVAAAEPAVLRRADGTSVYQIADAQRYTSPAILAAETRIVTAAGAGGARRITAADVDLAMLEWSANHGGAMLNTSQAALVTEVATTGRRLMLALAPAGTGKTTAMGVLARAWQSTGGTIVGLAPQASAAAELGAAVAGPAETLDKLVHDLRSGRANDIARWDALIGPGALVIVDEAGLASTPNLDTALRYTASRGGRMLLVGDDRQRAAPGAGGVLRDIEAAHGALSLTEVMRFTDRAEAQVSLAVRAGDQSAAAFYADRDRLHPVAADTVAEQVYRAWALDVAAGAESVMIAPTLEMVSQLNARARATRLHTDPAPGGVGRELTLPNGETVSAGDIIITKHNARTLPLGRNDFVRNNQRWTIHRVNDDGSITATLHGRDVTRELPAWYITGGHVRLGYAATAASVQGLTVGQPGVRRGTAHAVVTDSMSRNDLYPAVTRATDGTHLYLISTRHGDPHDVIRPESVQPATAAETLAAVIGRDGSAVSASSTAREAADPAIRIGPAADAYTHAVHSAAADLLGPHRMQRLTAGAEQAVPGVTTTRGWHELHHHLALLTLTGTDTTAALTQAAAARELGSAVDVAAVLDWRLDLAAGHGPLPWLTPVPPQLADNPQWDAYLTGRAALVTDLTEQLRRHAREWTPSTAPEWARPYLHDADLTADLAVWRASRSVPDTDSRPAGPRPDRTSDRTLHRELTGRALVAGGDPAAATDRWQHTVEALGAPQIVDDDFWPVLAARLTLADNAGRDVQRMLDTALFARPLPAEQPAAALWWRLAPHLGGLAAATAGGHQQPRWTGRIANAVGDDLTAAITQDPLWPTIIATIDAAARNGNDPTRLADDAAALLATHTAGLHRHQAAAALLCTITDLTDPEPPDGDEPLLPDPADDDLHPPTDAHPAQPAANPPTRQASPAAATDTGPVEPPPDVETLPPDPSDHHVVDHPDHAGRVSTPDRLLAAVADAHDYYTRLAPHSWVPGYLHDRGLSIPAAGYAPAGWDHLVRHLRHHGYTDTELLAAGLARTSSRGTLIDAFRDRAVLPIHNADGHVVAFTGRANPDQPATTNEREAPKYVNSPTTDIFHKTDLPYGLTPTAIQALAGGADLAICEGPLDAEAINTAAAGRVVAIAPLGTALTAEQLDTLGRIAPLDQRRVISAFDNDDAGRRAAARAYPLLASVGVDSAATLALPAGTDPADLLGRHHASALADAVAKPGAPLADVAVDHAANPNGQALHTSSERNKAAAQATRWIADNIPNIDLAHRQIQRVADAFDQDVVELVIRYAERADHSRWTRVPGVRAKATTATAARSLDMPQPPTLSAAARRVLQRQVPSHRRHEPATPSASPRRTGPVPH